MSEFLRPRLTGARFEGGAIPLDMLNDFSALGEMIVAVAKWRYFQDYPDRNRTPRGFAESASLSLTGVEEGSAVPVIDLAFTSPSSPEVPQLPGMPGVYEKYFEEAREHIIAAISSAEQDETIASILPDRYLRYFDRFGRRLHEGESIEFDSDSGANVARLTRASRRKLILASMVNEVTEEVIVRGLIPEADQDRMTFQIQLMGGQKIDTVMDEQHRETILEVFNRYDDKGQAWVRGIGKYDRQERLVKIELVEEIVALDPLDVTSRLEELRSLQDGWLDGEGRAPNSEGLEWLEAQFEQRFPTDLPLPHLYPTHEGGIRAEWSEGDNVVVLETNIDSHSASWLWFDRRSDSEDERDLNLEDTEDWNWWIDQIREKLSTRI